MDKTFATAAKLTLADGTMYQGIGFGAHVPTTGEVVFTTGMVGYPESLTDPSFYGQILVTTYPLVGNYGVPNTGFESPAIQVRGLIVSQYQHNYSHWQAQQSLHAWLQQHSIPAISGIDTRALTKKLRQHGVMPGMITFDTTIQIEDPNTANLAAVVSVDQPIWYGSSTARKKIVLIDCGVKQSIIDNFVQRGISVKRVPWDYDFTRELNTIQGIFISNGPGDPKQCRATIQYVRQALKTRVPQFGICLGSQIQGLAAGAKTYKLKYGHRGQNQPCIIEGTERALLTSQNHGYAVRESSIPRGWKVLFRNINDNSIEGLQHVSKPFFSVQFHPEAHPGPTDANYLFDDFIKLL